MAERPTVALGTNTDPESIDNAALELVRAAYRQKRGEDPPPEWEQAQREALAARALDGL